MDVSAVDTAKGEFIMTFNSEEQAKAQPADTALEPKATRKANAAPQGRGSAPAKGKLTKKATPGQEMRQRPRRRQKGESSRPPG